MTTKKFSNALGNIDEYYINEAAIYSGKRKRNTLIQWISVAACLSLMVMGGIFSYISYLSDAPDNDIMSYFVITAYAANGESTELDMEGSYWNSGTAQGNIFGVDMPIFDFAVRPSDLKNNEAIYSRFEIVVAYNGTVVEGLDEHVMVAYLIPTPNSNEPWAYSISGWFTEPTNIMVSVIDKESREIVESITVNVKYDADRQEYDLKITDLSTKFSGQKEE